MTRPPVQFGLEPLRAQDTITDASTEHRDIILTARGEWDFGDLLNQIVICTCVPNRSEQELLRHAVGAKTRLARSASDCCPTSTRLQSCCLSAPPSPPRHVPNANGMIVAAACKQFAVRRPCDTSHRLLVTGQCVEQRTSSCIPYLDRLVLAARCQQSTVRCPGHALDSPRVPFEHL